MPLPLEQAIQDRSATVGVIGLGYVGLPLVRAFVAAGFRTMGFDVDQAKVQDLLAGKSYIRHIPAEWIAACVQSGAFVPTADMGRLGEPDALLICVPTPLSASRDPDLTFIEQTARQIARTLRRGQLVVLESTTYPGTTREVVLPILAAGSLAAGRDFYLAFSPEREDPGNPQFSAERIPKVVGGIDAPSGRLAQALYAAAVAQVVPVSTCEVAEAAKILENTYRAVNIALVNEMKMVLTAMDIDIWQVIAAASTKPFGFQPFYPGPGLGGHCIPIDPYYLTWKAREVGMPTRFIELAGEINHKMPDYVVQRTVLALNERGKPIKGTKILILGLAYKPDVDDVRESPTFKLIEKYTHLGAKVDYNDPHVPATHRMRHYELHMRSASLSAQSLRVYDCVVIATHHSAYDWQMIADHASLIIDTRGVMRNVKGRRDHIVMA